MAMQISVRGSHTRCTVNRQYVWKQIKFREILSADLTGNEQAAEGNKRPDVVLWAQLTVFEIQQLKPANPNQS